MIVKKALVHPILMCSDCDWETEDYLKGQRLACKHVHETGHRITGDLGYTVRYEQPKEEP